MLVRRGQTINKMVDYKAEKADSIEDTTDISFFIHFLLCSFQTVVARSAVDLSGFSRLACFKCTTRLPS
jgi:hypothetical protein